MMNLFADFLKTKNEAHNMICNSKNQIGFITDKTPDAFGTFQQ